MWLRSIFENIVLNCIFFLNFTFKKLKIVKFTNFEILETFKKKIYNYIVVEWGRQSVWPWGKLVQSGESKTE
jgi:hypothetical protein